LRGFVRCESCGRGLPGSWSKGCSEYYAYYHLLKESVLEIWKARKAVVRGKPHGSPKYHKVPSR
jgi:hypothetical protein